MNQLDESDLVTLCESLAIKLRDLPINKWRCKGDEENGHLSASLGHRVKVDIIVATSCHDDGYGESTRTNYRMIIRSELSRFELYNYQLDPIDNYLFSQGKPTLSLRTLYSKIMEERQRISREKYRQRQEKIRGSFSRLVEKIKRDN